MPIKSKGGKGKPKPDQPAMRGALDHRKKETMLAVIVRNQKVLDQVRVLLKPRDLRDFGVHYGVVYQATLSCFDQYGEMPSQEMLLTEVQQQIKDNPGQMTDSEVDAAEEFISTAYDLPEWGGKDISTDATYAKFAIQTFKLFKEEALAERVQEATSRDGKFAADLAPMLRTVALEVDQARAVGRKVTDQPFPDGWQLRKLVPPVSSGISILNAFTGGGLKPGEVLLFMGPYGSCKCLGKGTPVLLFDGRVVPVQDVKVGDLLMGPDSKPRRVEKLYRGRDRLYRVTPKKGDPYVVNEAHILSLKRSPRAAGEQHQVVNISVRDYLAKGSYFKHQHLGWRVGVEFAESSVPLDPYFVGLWLGDGHTGTPRVTTADPEVVEYLGRLASRYGLAMKHVQVCGRADTWALTNGRVAGGEYNSNPLTAGLREIGIYDSKSIPQSYLCNSRRVRMGLLAGLLDADGSHSGGGYQFVSASRPLCDQVAHLCRSLGMAAYVSDRTTTCQGGVTCRSSYVTISGDLSEVPVLIPRRKASPRRQKKDVLVTGISVEPVGEGEYYGFEISGDHLFLLGDFTVTHNTTLAVQGVVAAAKLAYAKTKSNKNGIVYKTVYFSYEADREEFQERCLAYGARLPRRRQNKLKGNYLTAFAPDAELLPYELKMYAKQIEKGVAVPNEYARVNSTVKLLNEHLLFVDMTNADPEAGGQGLGGPNEVMAYLTLRKHENKKLRFHNIWIDHAAAMVGNMLDSDNYTFDDSRPILKQLPRQLRNWVAKRFKCQVYLLHQLSGEANKAAPTSQTHHTEADECKSIGMYPDFCVQTGPPTRDGRCLAVFDCTKHRRQPPKPRMVVRIDGQRNRVVSVNDKYTIENSTIVDTADAATVQVVAKKKKTDGGAPPPPPPPPPAAAKGVKKGKKGDIKPQAVSPFADEGAGG